MNSIRTKEYLSAKFKDEFELRDDHLEYMDIFILPHYGHLVCLEFALNNYKHPIHNDTHNIGYILHHFSKILEVREDGNFLRDISQSYKSVRSIWTDSPFGKRCVGIGHAWKDEFILFNEFIDMKVNEND